MDWIRSPLDQFFYTVVYAVIVYMIGLATFKLVDLIPNYILRWMGVGVKTFGEFAGDPGSEVMQKIGSGLTLVAVLGGGILGKMGANRGRNPITDEPESPT